MGFSEKKLRAGIRRLIQEELAGETRVSSITSLIFEAETAEELDDQVAAAVKAGPAAVRSLVNTADDDLLKTVLQGDYDNKVEDDVVDIGGASSIDVGGLIPTQREIDLMKSVSFPLSSIGALENLLTKKMGHGEISVSGNEVMDGHHRWSGVWGILGKEGGGKIVARDLDLPGGTEEKLAATQLAVAAHKAPDLPQPSESDPFPTNILGASSETIEQMIKDNVGNQTDPNAPGALLNNEFLSAAAQSQKVAEWAGFEMGADHETVIDAISKKVAGNLSDIPSNSGAPARADMPQVDHKTMGPDQDATKSAIYTGLESGKFNVSLPFDPVEEGTKKSDNLIMERWQRLAGLLQD